MRCVLQPAAQHCKFRVLEKKRQIKSNQINNVELQGMSRLCLLPKKGDLEIQMVLYVRQLFSQECIHFNYTKDLVLVCQHR